MHSNAPSRAIVDLGAYAHNLDVARQYAGPDTAIIAVVKANAYGHGLVPVAKRAVASGARMLAVATIDEGTELRESGIEAPILVMVQPEPRALALAVEHRLTLTLSDVESIEHLGEIAHRANRVASIHCKIDSGMGRQGFSLENAADRLQAVTRISHVDIEGVCTHFPTADLPDDTFTQSQIKSFRQLLNAMDKRGIPYEIAHAANSAALINYHGSAFDAVRPGLMTYGVWPLVTPPMQLSLKPVLRWETAVALVRDLEPGSSVGYGRTFTTSGRMRAAMLPVGYADGYKHALSNNAEVLIRGTRCPVRGSVCMDQIIVEVSHVPDIQPGDTATLIGTDGKECISVEELARSAGTIPYDILVGIGPRVPRVYAE